MKSKRLKACYKNRTYHPKNELVDGFKANQHPLYHTWTNMLSRCTNSSDRGYKNYGDRGISVCEEWFHFKNFAKDMGFKPTPEHTLERINNNLGYFPQNCRWATRTEQCLNRRRFANNKTGETGVVYKDGLYIARYDYQHQRHTIGWFKTKQDAVTARRNFIDLFHKNPDAALLTLSKVKARSTSTTKVRGVNPHQDGGFVVRCTINKARHYVGYFKSFEEAVSARNQFLATKT